MSEQYLRKADLVVAPTLTAPGIDLSEFHFKFTVRRGDIQTPNNADIRIYNLDDTTAKNIQPLYSNLILNAGYESSNFGLIFTGQINQSRRGRESPVDKVLDITADDGGHAYTWAVVNKAIAAGATPIQAWSSLAQEMKDQSNGQTVMGPPPPFADVKMPRGQVMFGMVRDYMRDLSKTAAGNWSIQDGQIVFNGLTQPAVGQAVELSPSTGLIGVPQQLVNGFHFRTLLNPNIKINTLVHVDAALIQLYRFDLGIANDAAQQTFVPLTDANGNYRVIYAEHTGDTRGQEWYTDMICLAMDDTKIPPSLFPKIPGVPPEGPVKAYGAS